MKIMILLLIIMGVSAFFGYYGCDNPGESTEAITEGKYTFETNDEYAEFKRFIGREDVTINRIKEYASEPPIVVEYKLRFPFGLEFPYGDVRGTYNPPWYAPFSIAICIITGIVGFTWVALVSERSRA